jgi:CheY-like chemotaxis protein
MQSVLVVEDSDDVRESYVRWLEMEGYSVLEARDGDEALQRAVESPPDLVLLDVTLPGIDGYQVAQRWRSDPRMASVPVIFLSGRSGAEHERSARDLGGVLALRKPCSPSLIIAAIRGALLS